MKLTVQHVDGLRFLTTVGDHAAVVDAAPQDGGTGTAMSAPQMFAAAVGACMLEFVANSCRLHDVSFTHLSLEMEYSEVERPRRIGALQATLRLAPEPPENVKRRLVGVAKHATLTNTLGRPPQVSINWGND